MKERKPRVEFLEEAIDEHLGDLTQRNLENYEPYHIEHNFQTKDIPSLLRDYFKGPQIRE